MHLHSSSDCSLRDETVTPGFTEEQERQLRCRYRAPKEQTQEDKWYTIYSILFPNANPSQYPSPCKYTKLSSNKSNLTTNSVKTMISQSTVMVNFNLPDGNCLMSMTNF